MNSFFKKSFSLLLTLCLMLLAFGLTVRVNAEGEKTYEKVQLANISSEDEIIIVSTKDDINYYAMSNDKGTSGSPTAVSVSISDGYLRTNATNIQWNITKDGDNLTIYPSGTTKTWLYCTNSNTGIRVGTNANKIFTIDASGYLKNTATERYLGAYISGKDWRCYTTIHANIAGQTFSFYKLTDKVVDVVSIVGDNQLLMVGQSKNLVAKLNSVETAASWSVDNSDYATIDAKGVLTPTENGVFKTVNVTATINETSSDPFAVTIYPNNENPISIAQALEICEFVGNTNSPFKYSAIGTVTNVQDKQFELLNEEKSIVVYMNSHNRTEGERIVVTGNLKNYSGTTPQFINPTFTSLYNVTFDSNGGTIVDGITDVKDGDKINAPAEPTKDGYVFQGWYNGVALWDFENDTVTSDLTLVAKWANETLNAFLNTFNTQAYMSMAYNYQYRAGSVERVSDVSSLNEGDQVIIVASDNNIAMSTTQNSNNRGQAPIVKSIDGISIDVNKMSDACVFTLEKGNIEGTWAFYDSNSKGYLYAASSSKNYLRTQQNCDNNASWTIAIENGVASIQAKGTNTNNVLQYNSGSSLFSCYGGATQSKISLYKYVANEFSNVDFRIRCGIDKDLATKVQTLGQEAVYGISVSTSEKEEKYASNSEFYQVEEGVDGKAYVIIDLGDVLNNSSRIDVEFTVRAYVEIDGETYYSSEEKCYSLVDLVQTYLNDENTKDLMVTLRTIFEGFGKNFN